MRQAALMLVRTLLLGRVTDGEIYPAFSTRIRRSPAMQKECIIFSRKQIPLSISEDRTVKRSVYPTNGGVEDFVMNDRCAAGTGRFLEVMAGVFQMDIETFSRCGLQAAAPYRISSTCTVFAESEVISGIAKGIGAEKLAAGLYDAVVSRITGMALTLGRGRRVALTGGVAKSMGIRRRMEKYFPGLQVPEEPQITGALGAALIWMV